MKKILKYKGVLLILCGVLAMSPLSACSQAPESEETGETAAPSVEAAASGSGEISGDGIFSINYTSGQSLNPYTSESSANLEAGGLIYEGLFALTEDFTAEEVLCSSYETEDGITYLITVKSGIKFSNGADLTASDVVYSLNCARNSAMYGDRLSIIEDVSVLTGDDVPADTVEIVLTDTHMKLPVLLNVPIIEYNSINSATPAGTGPYAADISAAAPHLYPNEYYWGEAELPVDTIYLTEVASTDMAEALEAGTLDIVSTDQTGTGASTWAVGAEQRDYDTTIMDFVGYNLENRYMWDTQIRLAISYAIDREAIMETVMAGAGTATPLTIHPASPDYDSSLALDYSFSMNVAAELLSRNSDLDFDLDAYLAGGDVLPTGISLTFLVNDDNASRLGAASLIAEALRELGIEVELMAVGYDEYLLALEDGDFDLYYGQIRLTADFNISSLVSGSLNYGNVSGSKYGALIAEYLASGESGSAAARDMCGYLLETSPFSVIGFRQLTVITMRGVVSGITPLMDNIYNDTENWAVSVG